ncbi:olfactory receptor 1468-like [Gastrophryne carolinensis]
MDEENVTSISCILLLGFQLPEDISFLVFCILFLMSGAAICGNLLIITVVYSSKTLRTPMYFFLSQLAVLDILVVMDILPTILIVLTKEAAISFSACIAQFYFFGATENLECLLLSVMSYDRYLAICKPLHYTLIMTNQICWKTAITCWSLDIIIVLYDTLALLKLQFCGPNIIDHFFCDLEPILKLSCTDTIEVQLKVKSLGAIFAVIPLIIITVSYIYIIVTVFKIPSITGRRKVFSTCSSHLTVVSIFYGTLISVYLVPHKGQLQHVAKFLSLLYTVVTPLMNPIIYSLRNKDLKAAIRRLINYTLNMNRY